MRFSLIRRRRPSPWKGAAAGFVGGLVASWTMNQFQSVLSKASEKLKCNSSGGSSQKQESNKPSEPESEDATMKVALKISESLLGTKLTQEERKKAGPVVHYLFGAAMGGFYGAVAEHIPSITVGEGVPFGTVIFLGADEIAVPALGLSKPPQDYPLSAHAYAWASHIVYGVTTEAVRKCVRREL